MKQCEITLKPYGKNGTVSRMRVSMVLDGWVRSAGEELGRMQLSTVSIPGCDAGELRVSDEEGAVPLRTSFSSPYPYELKHWILERSLCGKTEISYFVSPRVLKPEDICGPYFDLRWEDGGVNGAGLSFLMNIGEKERGRIRLCWDLSAMPAGSRGVCTFGEGTVEYEGSPEQLRQCYYAAGKLHSIEKGEFGFYWLTEPSFDMAAIAEYTRTLFEGMQKFFHDTDPVYRIFVRKDPFPTSGGTALRRSYMFGWNDTQPVSVTEKQNILAHEMVHNWPHLNDEPYGSTTWYSEGTAEYYSILLPLRLGLTDRETARKEIQKRTDAYYTNPTRQMENMEAARICWKDRRAQRISYGRGLFFLANTDVKIRNATEGEKNLDDVVLAILEKAEKGAKLGNQVLLGTVQEISGLDLSEDWERMRTGGHIVPLQGSFDGLFDVREVPAEEADTGKKAVSYLWELKK